MEVLKEVEESGAEKDEEVGEDEIEEDDNIEIDDLDDSDSNYSLRPSPIHSPCSPQVTSTPRQAGIIHK